MDGHAGQGSAQSGNGRTRSTAECRRANPGNALKAQVSRHLDLLGQVWWQDPEE